jgi:regulator of RNase E activity RraA
MKQVGMDSPAEKTVFPAKQPRKSDPELFAILREELFTAVLGDVLDSFGLLNQFFPPEIRPLRPDMKVVGRAMPVQVGDCGGSYVAYRDEHQPFGLMFQALDDLRAGEIYVATGGSAYAMWGELMTTRARQLTASGAIIDGYCRDSTALLSAEFAVFARGPYGQDQGARGRVIDYRCQVQLSNGVRVHPGELVVADLDGALVVPRDHEEQVIAGALEKVRREDLVRKALQQGMSATEAFNTYHVM